MDTKSIFLSKTFWIALLLFIASTLKLGGVIDLPVEEDSAWITVALSLIQIALRAVTKEPVTFKTNKAIGQDAKQVE